MSWLENFHSQSHSNRLDHEHQVEKALAIGALGLGAIVAFKGEGLSGLSRALQSVEETALPQLAAESEHSCALFSDAYRSVGGSLLTTGETAARETLSGAEQSIAVHAREAIGITGQPLETAIGTDVAVGVDGVGPVPEITALRNGASFNIFNPKTGQTLTTAVHASELPEGGRYAFLFSQDGKNVANFAYGGSAPGYPTAIDALYGNPPAEKPFLWLMRMDVQPEFRGQGIKEALVDELKGHSQSLGFGGRVKLWALADEDSVPAIPWYKSGFRPVEGSAVKGEKLAQVSDLLQGIVKSKMNVPLQYRTTFDNLMMELPET